jgi:hypothetical protein
MAPPVAGAPNSTPVEEVWRQQDRLQGELHARGQPPLVAARGVDAEQARAFGRVERAAERALAEAVEPLLHAGVAGRAVGVAAEQPGQVLHGLARERLGRAQVTAPPAVASVRGPRRCCRSPAPPPRARSPTRARWYRRAARGPCCRTRGGSAGAAAPDRATTPCTWRPGRARRRRLRSRGRARRRARARHRPGLVARLVAVCRRRPGPGRLRCCRCRPPTVRRPAGTTRRRDVRCMGRQYRAPCGQVHAGPGRPGPALRDG